MENPRLEIIRHKLQWGDPVSRVRARAFFRRDGQVAWNKCQTCDHVKGPLDDRGDLFECRAQVVTDPTHPRHGRFKIVCDDTVCVNFIPCGGCTPEEIQLQRAWDIAEAQDTARNFRLKAASWRSGTHVRYLNRAVVKYAKRLKDLLADLALLHDTPGDSFEDPFQHAPYNSSLWDEIRDLREAIAWCRARTLRERVKAEADRCDKEAVTWDGYVALWQASLVVIK